MTQLLDATIADDWERKAVGKTFTEKQKKDKFDRMKPFKAEKGGEKAKATIRILLYLSMYPQLRIISCLGYKLKFPTNKLDVNLLAPNGRNTLWATYSRYYQASSNDQRSRSPLEHLRKHGTVGIESQAILLE
jgi:hypothetical protein